MMKYEDIQKIKDMILDVVVEAELNGINHTTKIEKREDLWDYLNELGVKILEEEARNKK